MNASAVNKRLQKLEDKLHPSHDGTFTLEELCRSMWRQDKNGFRKFAEKEREGLFLRQFEFEDAERESAARRESGLK